MSTNSEQNQQNPYLANYLIQNAIWWVEYANLSGIRVDTYSYSDKAFLSKWTGKPSLASQTMTVSMLERIGHPT